MRFKFYSVEPCSLICFAELHIRSLDIGNRHFLQWEQFLTVLLGSKLKHCGFLKREDAFEVCKLEI